MSPRLQGSNGRPGPRFQKLACQWPHESEAAGFFRKALERPGLHRPMAMFARLCRTQLDLCREREASLIERRPAFTHHARSVRIFPD
jgi:hypothetical protein